MASAIVGGVLKSGAATAEAICCTCGDDPTGAELAARTGITWHRQLDDLLAAADTIVLACKPQQITAIEPDAGLCDGRLILSILAGTPLAKLQQRFPTARAIVRSMPNTPGQIGAGISAWCSASQLSDADRKQVEAILGALGTVIETEEKHLDAVTAVSGSGPAYLFEFAAALREAAIELELDPQTAEILVRQTLLGSALLLQQSDASSDELRDQVTSPGGTTAAALAVLKESNFRSTIATALRAARDRSIELAKI